jgi:hypothetical protein
LHPCHLPGRWSQLKPWWDESLAADLRGPFAFGETLAGCFVTGGGVR